MLAFCTIRPNCNLLKGCIGRFAIETVNAKRTSAQKQDKKKQGGSKTNQEILTNKAYKQQFSVCNRNRNATSLDRARYLSGLN